MGYDDVGLDFSFFVDLCRDFDETRTALSDRSVIHILYTAGCRSISYTIFIMKFQYRGFTCFYTFYKV